MIKPLLDRFARNCRGNVVILFALTLMPMLGLLGLAVDFSMTLRAKTALDAATDAAVLAAATAASQIIQSQSTVNFDATAIAIANGKIAGQNVFTANSAMIQTIAPPVFNLDLQPPSNGVIIAKASYTAQWPTVFGKMFNTSLMNIAGKSASSLNLPRYMNIYVATDISQSMGIGATQADMSKLSSLTGGCVFGCHVKQSGQKLSLPYEQIAHDPNNNVTLRIDIIKQSIKNMISSAQANVSPGVSATISLGLYSLQEDLLTDGAKAYTEISPPTTDYATLSSLASLIDLGNNDAGGVGDTDFANSINQLTTTVGVSGNGTSNSKQKFVFIMTDGVQDIKGACTSGHCTQAFDYNLCKTLKTNGVTVGVIYTTYIPIPNNSDYNNLVAPFQPTIGTKLSQCASQGWYYEATDGVDIQNTLNKLFAQAVSSQKLTQ